MIQFTEEMQQRVMLASMLRSTGNELSHLGSQITGRRSVTASDVFAARLELARAGAALDDFEKSAPPLVAAPDEAEPA